MGQNRNETQLSASNSESVIASESGSEEDWCLALPASLRAELLDPFQTHPETKVKGIDFLMKHCPTPSLHAKEILANKVRSQDRGVHLFPMAASF
jgi:hypothetical protein